MPAKNISSGTVHEIPVDLRQKLLADTTALHVWQDLTPLARNEFICWVENAKQVKTRNKRIERTCQELLEGKRRPCCWVGCIHRNDKVVSPSVKAILKLK